MKKSILIIAALALLSSCIHKELCFQHPHVIPLEIQFDWKDAPDASPEAKSNCGQERTACFATTTTRK